jgi:hypothetical protein
MTTIGRFPMWPAGSWGTSRIEASSPVGPGTGVLGTAMRMVPLATPPLDLLGSSMVLVSPGPCAVGGYGRVVVFVLCASGFASSGLCRSPPWGSFSDHYVGGPVLGVLLTRTATCAGCLGQEMGVDVGNCTIRPGLTARRNETRLAPTIGPPLPAVRCTALRV